MGEVVGPVPVWAAVAVAAAGLAGRGSTASGPPVVVERSWATLVAALRTPGGASLLVALLGAVVLLRAAHRARGREQIGGGAGALALLVVAATVVGGVALRVEASSAGVLPVLAAEGGSVPLELTVVAEPRGIAGGWHVLVRVDRVAGTAVRERAALVVEKQQPPALGERWRATASARPLPDGGYGAWLAQQHARVLLDVDGVERLGPGGPAARATEWLRSRVRQAATRHLDQRTGGLLVGLPSEGTRT